MVQTVGDPYNIRRIMWYGAYGCTEELRVFLQNAYRLEEGEKWDEESLRRRRSKNSGAIRTSYR